MSFLNGILESKKTAFFLTALFFCAGVILIFSVKGTGDEGDSILHYLFARYAPAHPELFFHHWAKPLFVLVASPFAHFGFSAMKFFNLALSSAALWLTFLIARKLKIKYAVLAVLFCMFSPMLMVLSLSGLTEPLFAFVLGLCILFYLNQKILAAVILVSFLPFVRSEGLIICGVFGFLLLLEKRFFLLPLLLVGHLVYGIAGYSTHHSFLWIITQIPYARLNSVYGKGTWEHFFLKTPFVTGYPLYGLLIAGVAVLLFRIFRKNYWTENLREIILIYGCFLSFFFAHVVFWALGIFNSFGVLRVLIGVLPLMAIIMLRGISMLDILPNQKIKQWILIPLLALIIIFPFTKNNCAWHFDEQFTLSDGEKLITQAVDFMKKNYPDYRNSVFYYDADYVSVLLDIDRFDKNVSRMVWENWGAPHTKQEFVFWDDWFSQHEMNLDLNTVGSNLHYEQLQEFTLTGRDGNHRRLVLFKSK